MGEFVVKPLQEILESRKIFKVSPEKITGGICVGFPRSNSAKNSSEKAMNNLWRNLGSNTWRGCLRIRNLCAKQV